MSRRRRVQHYRPGRVVSTGVHVDVSTRFGAATPEPIPGVHQWVMVACWRVDPTTLVAQQTQMILDHETMVSLDGPGCLVCERRWTVEVGAQPCSGHPAGGPRTGMR